MQVNDKTVKIIHLDDNDFRSDVVLNLYNSTIKDVFKEIAEVDKLGIVNFSTMLENALIYYIRSYEWQRAKHSFMTSEIDY